MNNEKPINSLLYIDNKTIVESETYDKRANIYFNLSSKDYDDIKNKSVYELEFTNYKSEDSQVCKLTVNIKKCEDKCEYCDETKCWDKNWTLIYEKEKKEEDKDDKGKDNDPDNPNGDKSSDKKNNKKGLKGYQIALIVIGIVLVIALIVGLILYFKFRSKKEAGEEANVEEQVDNEPLTS